jgi:hypothetical protein
MDKFYPDQLVQMAVGGNGKANNFFKEKGMGKLSHSGRGVDFASKVAEKYRADFEKTVKAACEALGVLGRSEATMASTEAEQPELADAIAPPAAEAPKQAARWQPGQRIQFRDKGSSTWKWGFVTHCKPLKVDYSARDEVRESATSPVLDAAAQRAIAFAASAPVTTTPVAPQAAPKTVAATKATPVPPQAAPKAATRIAAQPVTVVVRKDSASIPGATTAGSMKTQSLDAGLGFLDEEPEVSKPKPVAQPVATPAEDKAVDVPLLSCKVPAAKPSTVMDEQLDFDFDFD